MTTDQIQPSAATTIAIDAMGGDFGPQVTVPAALLYLEQSKTANHNIVLVGIEADIQQALQQQPKAQQWLDNGRLRIHNATQVVEMSEPPALALKKKKDSSMRVAINLVKEGEASACVSAGNTGALMATARFVLKTIQGIDRPAITTTMPCLDTSTTVHMLDLGANVDSSPEMLVQFAVMGSVLTKLIDGKDSPRVALLNVGAEEIKGSEKVKQASVLLSESELNYVGYIEGDELFSSKVDVIVTDGFEGNVALKASEGTVSTITKVLKQEFNRNIFTKLTALIAKPVFSAMQARLDPRLHNGASLIGLNGVVIKSHGGTDELGFLHAIQEAGLQAERNVISRISEEIKNRINT